MNEDDRRFGVGGNFPPADERLKIAEATKVARQVQERTNNIAKVTSQDEADLLASCINELTGALKAVDADRDARVRPMNERVKAINAEYAPIKALLHDIDDRLRSMNRTWLIAKDKERKAEAERAKLEAEAAQRAALAAQEKAALEAERAADGDVTEGDPDPVTASLEAQEATRQARIAEARLKKLETAKPRSGGGPAGRAIGLRTEEHLSIASMKDLVLAVREMGMRESIINTVLAAARAYRRETGKLPKGITAEQVKV